jgi:hypothetical protein
LNYISSNGELATIAGGFLNAACSNGSVVSGGCNNRISGGVYSTISGGQSNFATCPLATVIGGGGSFPWTANRVYATGGTVLGGSGNQVNHQYSVTANCNQSSSAACQFRVQALSKASGTFRIDHPNPEKTHTHYLSHSFVESPTAGDNIYRFLVNVENGTATIELPDYYKHLNTDDQVWVTPQGHFGSGYGIVNNEQTSVTIHANTDGEYNVLLIGTRKDIDAVHHWQGVESYK